MNERRDLETLLPSCYADDDAKFRANGQNVTTHEAHGIASVKLLHSSCRTEDQ